MKLSYLSQAQGMTNPSRCKNTQRIGGGKLS